MSMLSAQCDELRERANVLRQGRWSDGADDARLMEDAANTIWELRSMVHKERAEADRLREELEAVGTAAYLYGRDDLKAERDKLRELVARLIACVDTISNSDTFYYQPRRDGCGIDCTANGEHCSLVKICDQARKLGIEVE